MPDGRLERRFTMKLRKLSDYSGDAMVKIQTRHIAMHRLGEGAPTIILEAGLGDSSEWADVQDALANETLVVRYDRAGRRMSHRAPSPRSALDMAGDLHALVHNADLPAPYVLVGHGFGGLLMRVFAGRYLSKVAGLVLIDALHENQFETFGGIFPPPRAEDPPALHQMRDLWQGGWRSPFSTPEHIDFVASFEQARRIKTLGALPLSVVTAGTMLRQPGIPSADRAGLQQRWEEMQGDFAKISSDVTQTLVPDAGHLVQRENPQAVIDVIKDMLARVRVKERMKLRAIKLSRA